MAKTNLANMLRCYLAMERLSIRDLAPRIGVSPSTLSRVASGTAMDADTLLKIVNWMTSPLAPAPQDPPA